MKSILVTLAAIASLANAAPSILQRLSSKNHYAKQYDSSSSSSSSSGSGSGSYSKKPALTQIPAGITVPDGNELIAFYQGLGTQNYVCKNGQYTLVSVTAALFREGSQYENKIACTYTFNDKGQPVWTEADGSEFIGNPIVKIPAANAAEDIPNVLLQRADGTSSYSKGVLSGANYLVRLNTHDGVAPSSCYGDGEVLNVDYYAEYYFFGSSYGGDYYKKTYGDDSKKYYGDDSKKTYGDDSKKTYGDDSKKYYGDDSKKYYGDDSKKYYGDSSKKYGDKSYDNSYHPY